MKNFKAIAGVVLVFILGAASGALVTHMVGKSRLEAVMGGGPPAREEHLMRRLSRDLDLDGRQREQVRAIVHQTHEEIRRVRAQSRPQVEALLEQGQSRISAVLNPGQREKFERIVAERKARRPHGGS